jgi:hypothetical protein
LLTSRTPEICSLRSAALALLHLAEFQLDRRGAAINRHLDLEPGALLIDLLKDAKGPSETRTCSPTSKETDGFGRSKLFMAKKLRNLRFFIISSRGHDCSHGYGKRERR